MRLIIALVAWAAAAAGAAALSSTVAGSIHNSGSGSSSGSGGGSGGDPSSMIAADPSSMFHTASFAKAMAVARSQLGPSAKLDNFVIYPGYLSATGLTATGQVDFYVNVNGDTNNTTSDIPSSGTKFLSLAQISDGAPAAIAARIANEAHVPLSQLHYMVAELDPISEKFQWLVYTIAGSSVEYFQVPGHGGTLLELPRNGTSGPVPVGG